MVLTALYSTPRGAPPRAMYRRGATTPSEAFSATVSTAARVTPAASRLWVSRPTIMLTALRAAGRSPASRASCTRMLSTRRDLVASIWQQITVSTARPSQGLTRLAKTTTAAATAQETRGTRAASTAPAASSPLSVLGKAARSGGSRAQMSRPIHRTGWGMLCGSPTTRSSAYPRARAARCCGISMRASPGGGLRRPPRSGARLRVRSRGSGAGSRRRAWAWHGSTPSSCPSTA